MDAQWIYTAAAGALDSWDMENIKYIRKLSQTKVEVHNVHLMENETSLSESPDSKELDTGFFTCSSSGGGGSSQVKKRNSTGSISSNMSLSSGSNRKLSSGSNSSSSGAGFRKLSTSSNSSTIGFNRKLSSGSTSSGFNRKLSSSSQGSSGLSTRKTSSGGSSSVSMSSGSVKLPPTPVPDTAAPALDSCYVLDVVTVRNESVIAVCTPNPPSSSTSTKSPTKQVLQPIQSSASSMASSSSRSLDSPIEATFFDVDADVDADQDVYSDSSGQSRSGSTSCGTTTTISTIVKNEVARRPKPMSSRGCPFCCESPKTNGNYYYLGQYGQLDEISMVNNASDSLPSCSSQRSPSPYYVRLRRDLIPAYTPIMNPPRNFGMDKQGRLVIDYSPNWDGLEHYVRNLSLKK